MKILLPFSLQILNIEKSGPWCPTWRLNSSDGMSPLAHHSVLRKVQCQNSPLPPHSPLLWNCSIDSAATTPITEGEIGTQRPITSPPNSLHAPTPPSPNPGGRLEAAQTHLGECCHFRGKQGQVRPAWSRTLCSIISVLA